MNKFGEYLKELIDESGMNEAQLTQRLKIKSRSYLTEVEKGRSSPPPPDRCEQIAKILNLSKEKRQNLLHLAALGRSPDEFKPYVEQALSSKSQVIGMSQHMSDYSQIPILGACPASPKRWVHDEVEAWHYLPKELVKNRRLYILRIFGDSMDRYGMNNGDLILVDAEAQPQNGDVVVVRVDDECTVKRYYKDGSQVTLTPESSNEKHRPMVIDLKKSEVIFRGVVDSIYMRKIKRGK